MSASPYPWTDTWDVLKYHRRNDQAVCTCLNWYMRCIEIYKDMKIQPIEYTLNWYMRCIEIIMLIEHKSGFLGLNWYMRCIEMWIPRRLSATGISWTDTWDVLK